MKYFQNLKRIKGTALGIMLALLFALLPGGAVKAAEPYSVTFSDPSCYVGDNVTVTMTVKPAAASVDLRLAYTAEFLSMTSFSGGLGNASISYNANSISVNDYASSGAKTATYSFVFKTLKAGTGRVTITEVVEITDANGDPYSAEGAHNGNSAITISTKPAPTEPATTEAPTQPPTTEAPTEPPTQPVISSEARLASVNIAPGKWNRSFDPDVLEYTIEVDADTDLLSLSYSPKESHANVIYWPYTAPSQIKVVPGTTNFYLRVTAQDGSTQKQYHIAITRPVPPETTPEETTPEETTAAETTPEETTPAETTPEETTPEETTPEETTTEEETTEPVPMIRIPSQVLEIMDFPEDFEIPMGYKPSRMMDEEGAVYNAFIPADSTDYDHYLVYGAKDGANPDLYIYDTVENTLQRYVVAIEIPETTEEPTSTEEETEEPTTTAEETTTEAETTTAAETTEAVTPEETQAPTSEPYRVNFLNGDTKVPGWVTTVAAALLAICLLTILLLLLARRRDKKAVPTDKEELSPEEEDAFLRVTSSTIPKTEAELPDETAETAEEAMTETAEETAEDALAEAPEIGEADLAEEAAAAFETIQEDPAPEKPEKREIDIPL